MDRSFVFIVVFVVLCTAPLLSCHRNSEREIAFIRSAYLIENFRGTKEVLKKYNDELARQQQEIDSLQQLYAAMQEQLRSRPPAANDLQAKEQALLRTREQLSALAQAAGPGAQEEREKLMQGALNQINHGVEQYARAHNIRLVLGVTLDGNVLYGDDGLDITDEVLSELNEKYK